MAHCRSLLIKYCTLVFVHICVLCSFCYICIYACVTFPYDCLVCFCVVIMYERENLATVSLSAYETITLIHRAKIQVKLFGVLWLIQSLRNIYVLRKPFNIG